jgi:PPOX class probable F420-dependent enzyme
MNLERGDLAVLDTDLARRLLTSTTPARVAYVATDGTPRVVPIWFHWNGREIVLGTSPGSPKLAALARRPEVAVTIDTIVWPYQALMIRGTAAVEMVDGVVPEYALSATRYFGPEQGPAWIEQISPDYERMARVVITPTWAWLLDYEASPEPQ